jgi:hypothetical protein
MVMMLTGAHIQFSCDFDSAYICGYSSSQLGELAWSRTSGSDTNKLTGPTADSNNSPNGQFSVCPFIIS